MEAWGGHQKQIYTIYYDTHSANVKRRTSFTWWNWKACLLNTTFLHCLWEIWKIIGKIFALLMKIFSLRINIAQQTPVKYKDLQVLKPERKSIRKIDEMNGKNIWIQWERYKNGQLAKNALSLAISVSVCQYVKWKS